MMLSKFYLADLGKMKSGLTTVGLTLSGGPGPSVASPTTGGTASGTPVGVRVSSGVSEVVAGSGIYGATLTHDASFVGALVWDTGESAPSFAAENINPPTLGPSGLDAITIESGVNARQALSPILASTAGVIVGSGTGTISIKGGNTAVTRITAATDNSGNRTTVTLSLPT